MRWFESPNINFVGNRKVAYIVSTILVLISIGAIVTKGLQYGIDFKGGKEIILIAKYLSVPKTCRIWM